VVSLLARPLASRGRSRESLQFRARVRIITRSSGGAGTAGCSTPTSVGRDAPPRERSVQPGTVRCWVATWPLRGRGDPTCTSLHRLGTSPGDTRLAHTPAAHGRHTPCWTSCDPCSRAVSQWRAGRVNALVLRHF